MLLTLEGLDGSGKTTVARALEAGADPDRDADAPVGDALADATFTSEPTDSWYGEAVRRSIRDDDADPLAELFLFTADHADHLSRLVRPELAADNLVISDRYSDSRFAYQTAALAETDVRRPLEFVRGVHRAFSRPPDATVYLDVDPETAAARSGATDKLERAAFLADVRDNYERLIDAEPDRFVRVDADRSPEVVLERVEDVIARLLADD